MSARVSSPRFVGRRGELTSLVEIWKSACADDQVATVLVAGEAGVGKSRLVAELADGLPAPALVLVGHCIDLVDRALPFGPVVQVLRTMHRVLDEPALREIVEPARDELGALVPELHAPSAQGLDSSALFEQLLGVFERLARHVPTLLVFEDLHWADSATRNLFVFLARTLRDAPLVLMGTYRSDDLHRRHPLRPMLAELERSGRVERLEVQRFDRDEMRELIAAIVGDEPTPDVVERTYERSDGNAFFAEELLASGTALSDTLPPTLRDIILARIDALTDDAQHMLRCAAVIGRSADHRLLSATAGLDPPTFAAVAREAIAAQILVTAGDAMEYRFRHALVREAVEDDLLPGDRVALHTRVAELLAEHPDWFDGGPAQISAELACHWDAARDVPRALEWALAAARSAEQMYAYGDALAHVERALALWPHVPDAATRFGTSHVELMRYAAAQAEMSGSTDRALHYVQAALAEVDAAEDPVVAGLLHERYGRYLWMLGKPWPEILDHCDTGVRLVPAEPPTEARAKVLATLGQQLMLAGRSGEAIAACEDAIRVAQAAGALAIEGHARNSLGTALAGVNRIDEGLDELHRARALALETRSWVDVARAAVNEGGALQTLGRHEEVLALSLEGAELARAHGLDRAFGVFLRLNAAETLWLLGRWDELEEQLRYVESLDSVGIDLWRLAELRCLVAAGRQQLDAARRELARFGDLRRRSGSPHDPLSLDRALVFTAAAEGDLEAAFRMALDGVHSPVERATLCTDAVLSVLVDGAAAGATLAARAAEQGNRADGILAEVAELAAALDAWVANQRWGGARPGDLEAIRAHVAAELARARGDSSGDAWSEVAARWAAFGLRPREAYAQWRAAEAYVHDADRLRAEDAVRRAYTVAADVGWIAVRDGAASLARRARLDLGVDDAAPAPAERYGLTPREVDVLALIAEGRTNRQIADALFISTKTASVHVSNILAKLGAANRGEAAAAARRLGLDAGR